MTRIMTCTCQHRFQDTRYGKQQRVYNSCHAAGKTVLLKWRCTVCGNEKEETAHE